MSDLYSLFFMDPYHQNHLFVHCASNVDSQTLP